MRESWTTRGRLSRDRKAPLQAKMPREDARSRPNSARILAGSHRERSLIVRTFHFLDQVPDFVETITRLQAEVLGSHFEGFLFLDLLTAEQSHPQRLVHSFFKRLAG